jgi:transcriptional regulator with XRE-family HTH domain
MSCTKVYEAPNGVNRNSASEYPIRAKIGAVMHLHEAVKKARKDLGLSQDKLSQLAGIQRRQLATLERGGNVTLVTLRKVLAHLPNLETFTLDTVTAKVTREIPRAEMAQATRSALQLLGTALHSILHTLDTGQPPDERVRQQIDQANQIFYEGLGLTPEEIALRKQAAAAAPVPSIPEEQLKEVFTSMVEKTEAGLQKLDQLKFPEEEELPEHEELPEDEESE